MSVPAVAVKLWSVVKPVPLVALINTVLQEIQMRNARISGLLAVMMTDWRPREKEKIASLWAGPGRIHLDEYSLLKAHL
jgi:hypothetical protein